MADVIASPAADLDFRVRTDFADPEWDSFVERTPGGHHVQSSLWAQVKAVVGWMPLRVVAVRDDVIVGGVQILMRPITGLGRVGYIANGPVSGPGEQRVGEAILDEVGRVVRRHRVRHLTIQPPLHSVAPAKPKTRHYLPSSTQVAPRATSLIDLDPDLDTILARMQRKTRYNVRVSDRKGISVRNGGLSDVGAYHAMVVATAERKGFSPFPREYFEEMWRVLYAPGHLRLAIADYDGEPVAAQLAVAFGSTVVNKLSVWSGREGSRRPNEALQWSTIRWAKQAGYHTYDLEGIDVRAARLLLAEQPLPDSFDQTVTSFKLGFGGQIVMAPEPHEFVYNRTARWVYREMYPRLGRHRPVKRFVKRLRTTSA
jgi:lipid II:glycine glycyltransferase (peptidoglycan interpeptide bridge formation enzyme)